MAVIMIFRLINNESVIESLYTVAGYTYGPLLGMYAFGLFTRWKVHDKMVPYVAIASPLICVLLNTFSEELFRGYRFGFELLIVNGVITFLGMMLIRRRNSR
jgi:hypothetical protein